MLRLIIAAAFLGCAAVAGAQTLPSRPGQVTPPPVTQNTPGIGTRFHFDQYNQMLAGPPQDIVIRENAGAHLDGDGQGDLTLEVSRGATGVFSRLVSTAFPAAAFPSQIGRVDDTPNSPTRAACLDALGRLAAGQSRLLVSSHNAPRYYCVRTTSGLYGRMTLLQSTGERVDEMSVRVELWR